MAIVYVDALAAQTIEADHAMPCGSFEQVENRIDEFAFNGPRRLVAQPFQLSIVQSVGTYRDDPRRVRSRAKRKRRWRRTVDHQRRDCGSQWCRPRPDRAAASTRSVFSAKIKFLTPACARDETTEKGGLRITRFWAPWAIMDVAEGVRRAYIRGMERLSGDACWLL